MKRSATLTSLLITVGLLPNMAQSADMVTANLTSGLNSVGTISIQGIMGNQHDAEQAIARKTDEKGASYYRILRMQKDSSQNCWGVTAEMYR